MQNRNKLILSGLLFVVVLVSVAVLNGQGKGMKNEERDASFSIELATTTAAQERGLSGRENIPPNYGMLFVFKAPNRYGFWMKDMKTAIDIVWLSDNFQVLGIERNVSPNTYPTVFYPPQPVRYVLETRVDELRAHGWGVGSMVPL